MQTSIAPPKSVRANGHLLRDGRARSQLPQFSMKLPTRSHAAQPQREQRCEHLRRRLIYRRHSLFAEMVCRKCGRSLGRLLKPN